jgi:hypothetical protein
MGFGSVVRLWVCYMHAPCGWVRPGAQGGLRAIYARACCLKSRWDFIVELFPRRAVAHETLVGCSRILVDLRGVRDRASTAWARDLEFLEFPLFWSWFVVTSGGRLLSRFGLQFLEADPSIIDVDFIWLDKRDCGCVWSVGINYIFLCNINSPHLRLKIILLVRTVLCSFWLQLW